MSSLLCVPGQHVGGQVSGHVVELGVLLRGVAVQAVAVLVLLLLGGGGAHLVLERERERERERKGLQSGGGGKIQ